MNKHPVVKIEGSLEASALEILRTIPGLEVEVAPRMGRDDADAVLRFAGVDAPIVVEFKHRANAATASQLARYAAEGHALPLLLVAGETTADAREILEREGIGFIDGIGNAHVQLPGLLVHREGGRRPKRAPAPHTPRLSGKAGVAVQTLLHDPERDWKLHELADEAGISAGLAHRVLTRLESEGLVVAEGRGPNRLRRIRNAGGLLDLWNEEQTDRPKRTLAYLLARSPQQLLDELGTSLDEAGVPYALTGMAGAALVAPFATALPVADVWVSSTSSPLQLCEQTHAEPVHEGANVIFLQAKDDTPLSFREKNSGLWVTNRFRLYVDLKRDPRRGHEQAEHLRQAVIGF